MRKFTVFTCMCTCILMSITFGFSQKVRLVQDINDGASNADILHPTVFKGKLYFRGNDGTGQEIWVYDGDTAVMMKDMLPSGNFNAYSFFEYNDSLFFKANDGVNGMELWVSDGDTALLVKDINPAGDGSPAYFVEFNSELFFAADNGTDGVQLWKYNSTGDPTMVSNLNTTGFNSIIDITEYQNKLYFYANVVETDREMYVYDGASATLAFEIDPSGAGGPTDMTVFHDTMFFAASESTFGDELYYFDGTNYGMIADIMATYYSGSPTNFIIYHDTLFLTSDNADWGKEIFFLDGDTVGIAVDINPGGAYSNPQYLTIMDDKIYFSATSGSNDYELWSFDGDTAIQVAEINPTGSASPYQLTVYNNKLYFRADDGVHGQELWEMCINSYSEIDESACDSYTSPSGKYMWTSTGTYLDTIPSASNCDSVITINLTIQSSSSSIDVNACNSYTSPSGNYTWTTSNTYLDTIDNAAMCDSVITINLTIHTIADTSLSITDSSITALATNATFKWLDCSSSYSELTGETDSILIPDATGSFAVEVSQNGCVDTSFCKSITVMATGIETTDFDKGFTVFPNPTTGLVNIGLGKEYNHVKVDVKSISGQLISTKTYGTTNSVTIDINGAKGMYIIEVHANNNMKAIVKVVKH